MISAKTGAPIVEGPAASLPASSSKESTAPELFESMAPSPAQSPALQPQDSSKRAAVEKAPVANSNQVSVSEGQG